jgi:NAD(P)-dependent dehydrogenase (short-subunit alcohol dehydrogenase family)
MASPETADAGCVVVIGGTSGIGLEVARHYARQGLEVVLSGRDADRAGAVADKLGGRARGIGLDLTMPDAVAGALSSVPTVRHLVLAAIDRDHNTAADYDIKRASYLVTLKLVGYTEVVHALVARMTPTGSIVVFGGQAKERPYPGSTTISMVNSGMVGMVNTLASELSPIRVNGIHPGIVGDSPYWSAKPPSALEPIIARTPIGRLVTMAEVTHAVVFLLENTGVNGANLVVDGGWTLK